MLNKDDEKLVEEAKNDSKKYQMLYDKYYQKVYNYFWYRNGHDKELSEDMMQEVFIRAFKKLPDFKLKDCSYLTYLLTIAHNLLVNHYRDSKREGIIKLDKIPDYIIENVDDSVDIGLMWQKIYTLPIAERDVLLLRYRQELPIKEISLILGKSENAVKLIISRSKKKLSLVAEPKVLAKIPSRKKNYTEPEFMKNN